MRASFKPKQRVRLVVDDGGYPRGLYDPYETEMLPPGWRVVTYIRKPRKRDSRQCARMETG